MPRVALSALRTLVHLTFFLVSIIPLLQMRKLRLNKDWSQNSNPGQAQVRPRDFALNHYVCGYLGIISIYNSLYKEVLPFK